VSALMRSDPNPFVRMEAARTTERVELFATDLFKALEDPDVRVREAAAQKLARHPHVQTIAALSTRLQRDAWPLVRVAAAESLARQPANANADAVLTAALNDASWLVKVAAAESVATRRLSTAGEPLLDLFSNKKERHEVRIAAARALGDVCYDRALDPLTDAARSLKSPGADPRDRAVASSALDALAKLHPNDLASRLEPLLNGKSTPAGTRQAAKDALAAQPHCSVPAALTTARVDDR
jgi:HEAT repeat protein